MSTKRRHLHLPPERFFWAVLRPAAAGLSRTPSTTQLGYLFEEVLPVPIETVNAAYVPLHDGMWAACGMLREELAQELTGEEVTLTPSKPPQFLAETFTGDELTALNLLTGEFEPAPVRRWRRRCALAAVLLLATASAVLTLVFHVQEREVQARIAGVQSARQALLDEVLGSGRAVSSPESAGSRGQPPELRLLAELRQLRRTRQPDQSVLDQPDVTIDLVRLLTRWPTGRSGGAGPASLASLSTERVQEHIHSAGDRPAATANDELHVMTELISVTPATMNVRAILTSSADAERFAAALRTIPEWELSQPRITSTRENVQAVLRFAPRPPASESEEGGL